MIGDGPAPTGLFFDRPEPAAIAEAVRRFLAQQERFRPIACHANARRFDEARFAREFRAAVDRAYAEFTADRDWKADAALPADKIALAAAG